MLRHAAALLRRRTSIRPGSTARRSIPPEVLGELGEARLLRARASPRSTAASGLSELRGGPGGAGDGRPRRRRSPSLIGAHQSLGTRGIQLFGTDPHRSRHYLSRTWRAARASLRLPSPSPRAGSDAAGIQTRAILKGDRLRAEAAARSGSANGAIADVFVVFARTSAPNSGSQARDSPPSWSTAIPWRPHRPQRRQARRARQHHHRGRSSTTSSSPSDAVLGERGSRLQGRDAASSTTAGSVSPRVAWARRRRSLALSIARVQERRAFGRSIGEFALIKDKIADMLAETFALESMVYLTCSYADRIAAASHGGPVDGRHGDYAVESAICKVFGSEVLWRIANESLQIAAGSGYMAAFPYERLLARRPGQLDLRGHQRDPALLHRAVGRAGSGPRARRLRRGAARSGRDVARSHPGRSVCSRTSRFKQAKSVLVRDQACMVHTSPWPSRPSRFEYYRRGLRPKQVQRALRRYGRNHGRDAVHARAHRRHGDPALRDGGVLLAHHARACTSAAKKAPAARST